MRRERLLALLGCFVGLACGGSEVPNLPPAAALAVIPVETQVSVPVSFDASSSTDPDGRIASYRFLFGDGSPAIVTAAPVVEHAFARMGYYQVTVVVTDDDGAEGRATAAVTVREDMPPPGCLGDDECRPSEHCLEGRCVPAVGCGKNQPPCLPPLECQGPDDVCRCPGGGAQCGDACVDLSTDLAHCGFCGRACMPGQECRDGRCLGMPTCRDGLTLCPDGSCVDTKADPNNCGFCGNVCPDDAQCIESRCQSLCLPGLTWCPDGSCTDLSSDPSNCGFCGNLCPAGQCFAYMCQTDPPGTVYEVLPRPPFERITGMTTLGDTFYLMTGRRFVEFDPYSGAMFGNWFIENQTMRRALGLAGDEFGGQLLTSAYDRFSPFSDEDIEGYFPYDETAIYSAPGIGGPIAETGGDTYYIYENTAQMLLTFSPTTGVLDGRPVSGASFGDRFTDAAIDGYGGLWLVRPNTPGVAGPLMRKLDITTATFTLDVMPPDPDGIGGIVLVGGRLWGAGRNAVYIMAP